MRLVLERKVSPYGKVGRLYLGRKFFCWTREMDLNSIQSINQIINEGVYELLPECSEEKGWWIKVGNEGSILAKSSEFKPFPFEICPVTFFRKDGTPMFSKLAFQQLLEKLTPFWEKGEVIELQIVSESVDYILESCLERSYC